jgi:hypothetical protein
MDEAFASMDRLLVYLRVVGEITAPEISRRLLDLNPSARTSVYERSGHAPLYYDHMRLDTELAAFAAI